MRGSRLVLPKATFEGRFKMCYYCLVVTKLISRTWKPLENLESFIIVYYNTTRHVNDNTSLYIQYRCAYKPGIEFYFYLIQKTSVYYQQINRVLEIRN